MNYSFMNYLYNDSIKSFDKEYVADTIKPIHNPHSIKPLAFYLPQFYPTDTNNKNWGNGFTEWNNVIKGLPAFIGHYQPHMPEALGFYDLRQNYIFSQQVQIAQRYSIYGFCFYVYDFGGQIELRLPIKKYCETQSTFPFCLCWANENWSRRWDGQADELLIRQTYNSNHLYEFIQSMIPFFERPNYIKVNGAPLFLIYNPKEIPDLLKTTHIWRECCRKAGIPDLYLVGFRTFGFNKAPFLFGLNSLADFPPHNCYEMKINEKIEIVNPFFSGTILDAQSYVNNIEYFNEDYVLPGVFPSWDNTPRRGNTAKIFINTTPELFYKWLEKSIYHLKRCYAPEERFLFINAWNEWGEGAHLEPDRKYGYAYLSKLRDALKEL